MSVDLSAWAPEGGARRTSPIAFLVLLGVVTAFAVMFYQVIRPLALPLFLAAVIALLAHPLLDRVMHWVHRRASLAAGLVTLLIVLVFLGPLGTAVTLAILELRGFLERFRVDIPPGGDLKATVLADFDPRLASIMERIGHYVPIDPNAFRGWILRLGTESGQVLYERTLQLLTNLPGFVIGLVMFLIALYFFLRDGERMVRGWEQMTPLSLEHDRLIRTEFIRVCRGVVLGTVLAALLQGFLFGVALFAIDLAAGTGIGKWTFLLSLLTAGLAMIPFLGAAAVWLPTALLLLASGHHVAGVVLIVYGALIISTADNVVKVLVIGESANLHPLLVFVSVFGGIQAIGFLGIFVGPIVGAVLFALLRILRREIVALNRTMSTPNGPQTGATI